MKDKHGYELEPIVYITTCENCGERVYARKGDILEEGDWSDSIYYGKCYRKSLICPLCGHQNVLETKEIDGTIRQYGDYKSAEPRQNGCY